MGKFIDFEDDLTAVETAATLEPNEIIVSVEHLLTRIREMPANHPLGSIFSEDFQSLLDEQLLNNPNEIPWDDQSILEQLPMFEKGVLSAVDDQLSLEASSEMGPDGYRRALQALVEEVGLQPEEAVKADPTDRIRIFDEKSRLLSNIFTDSWVRDVDAEFVPFNQDRDLGLAISCQGSLDPPSRRSQGFNSYLGLIAKLLEIGRRSSRNLVFLLDDPAMHLHPTAQEKLADVLGRQQFQVLAATHFPFMISPDRLDRVRLLCRMESGAYLEDDWHQAGDGLLPIKGAMSKWTLGRFPVLVEGKSDREVLVEISELLRQSGKDSMSGFMEPLPGGGASMPYAAKALRAMDVRFIALVDGDRQGDDIKRRLMRDVGQPEDGIISMRDIVDGIAAPELEHLFSQTLRDSNIWADQGLGGLLKELKAGRITLDQESEEKLQFLFQMLNEALAQEFYRKT